MATGGEISGSNSRGSEEMFYCTHCSKDNDKVEAVNQCLNCREYYCGTCINFHNKLCRKEPGSKPKKPRLVQDHYEHAIIYCTDHDVICCNTCKSISHKNCDGITFTVNITQGINYGSQLKSAVDSKVYEAKLKGDFSIKVQQDKESCDSAGACLLPDGTVMVTDRTNKRLKRLDASYSVTGHCDMPGGPYDVTCTAPDEVAVTLREVRKVQFVSVRGSMSLTRSFSTSDVCRGICYSAGELFVVCGGCYGEGPGHVAVYNINGDRIRTLQTDPSGQQLFSLPLHITASLDGARIYVADINKGVVSSDRSGKPDGSFTHPSLKNAYGVCTLDDGHVVVCGGSSHNVLQIDSDGRSVTELLKASDGIYKPMSLCYDNRKSRLIVTMTGTDTIKVFDLA